MSTKVVIRVRHSLGRAEAMRRIRQRAEELHRENALVVQNVHAEWGRSMSLFRLTALGQTFTAIIETTDRIARLEIEVPPQASSFADRLKAFVGREARRALA